VSSRARDDLGPCSQGSAVSSSDSSRSDFAPSGKSSATATRDTSYGDTGHSCRNTKMCAQWERPTWRPLTSSAEDFPARGSVTLGGDWDSRIHDPACGASLPESFASFDRDSCSWRTSQLSVFGGLDEYSATWPRSGTMRSGIVYERPTSGRPISEIVSFCLPTPAATNHKGNRSVSPGASYRPSLREMAKMGLWPTPTARDGRDGDARACGQMPIRGHLGRAVHRWPTPSVKGNHNRKGASATSGDGLATAVTIWPTPRATDGTKGGPNQRGSSGDPTVPSAVGGALNPTWVAWLMGFPLEWTNCVASVMQSSRRRRRSRGAC
jgi:hypothetical protein